MFSQTFYTWSGKVHLPAGKEIDFRYFIAYILEPDNEYVKEKHTFVHSWESHHEPRTVQSIKGILFILTTIINIKLINSLGGQVSSNDNKSQCDVYGLHGIQQISKGFLTSECAVQFKLYDMPIKFWSSKLQNQIVCRINRLLSYLDTKIVY